MKNPVRAGLSRLWATREKSQKNPPLRRFGDRLRKSYDPYPSDFGLRRLKFPFRTPYCCLNSSPCVAMFDPNGEIFRISGGGEGNLRKLVFWRHVVGKFAVEAA
jgi:hypothetical protein